MSHILFYPSRREDILIGPIDSIVLGCAIAIIVFSGQFAMADGSAYRFFPLETQARGVKKIPLEVYAIDRGKIVKGTIKLVQDERLEELKSAIFYDLKGQRLSEDFFVFTGKSVVPGPLEINKGNCAKSRRPYGPEQVCVFKSKARVYNFRWVSLEKINSLGVPGVGVELDVNGRTQNLGMVGDVIFAGDINRDGYLDFIFERQAHASGSMEFRVYFGKKKGEPLEFVSNFYKGGC